MRPQMAKRSADTDLNHENWDEEPADDEKERGSFSTASAEVLKERVKKVATRKSAAQESNPGLNIFKGFTGFGSSQGTNPISFNTSSSQPTSSTGSTVTSLTTTSFNSLPSTAINGSIAITTQSSLPRNLFTFGTIQNKDKSPESVSSTNDGSKILKSGFNTEDKHLQNLKCLNKAFVKWISEHVSKNPYCDLIPVLRDYEKHMAMIHEAFPYNGGDTNTSEQGTIRGIPKVSSSPSLFQIKSTVFDPPAFDFSSVPKQSLSLATQASTSSSSTVSSTFGTNTISKLPIFPSFGNKPFSGGTFESKSTPITVGGGSSSLFPSFGTPATSSSTGFCFSQTPVVASSGPGADTENDNEEYVPPKPEVKEIKEEGSVYTTRCKLFYKVGNGGDQQWKERGIGNLHLKPLESGKLQIVMRADNNLGTILLNIAVTKAVPFSVQKNNVSMICVPSPALPVTSKEGGDDAANKVVPMLIRVKTETDADNLLTKINELRG